MTDETDGISFEGEDEEVSGGLTIDMGESPPVYVLEGQNYSVLFANPAHPAHPFYWVKGCVGATVYSKPGSQQPDELRYIVKVGDGFEERLLSEVFHHESDKEYVPIKRSLKTVN